MVITAPAFYRARTSARKLETSRFSRTLLHASSPAADNTWVEPALVSCEAGDADEVGSECFSGIGDKALNDLKETCPAVARRGAGRA